MTRFLTNEQVERRAETKDSAHFGHREHPDRSIVNTQIGIVNTGIGDRERSVATPGVQASRSVLYCHGGHWRFYRHEASPIIDRPGGSF